MIVEGTISLYLQGCSITETIEIDDADIPEETENLRREWIHNTVREYLMQYVEVSYEVVTTSAS